jgi:MoaA/NifB/PqqE/SkfB family radical SAM enzyme
MLLDRKVAAWLLEDGSLDQLVFSFDGARKETLEAIRRGASYETILENLDYLVRLKQGRGRRGPEIIFHAIAMRSNALELPDMVTLCARHGVSALWVNYLNASSQEEFQESLFHQRDLAAQVFAETRRRGRELGVKVALPPLPEGEARSHRCWQPWQFCQIDTDGSLRFCYRSWRQRLGFFQEGFTDLWRGEHYRKLRATVNTEHPYFPFCRHCPERLGFGHAAAHHLLLHPEDQIIPGLAHLQIPFNRRAEENLTSFREARENRETRS